MVGYFSGEWGKYLFSCAEDVEEINLRKVKHGKVDLKALNITNPSMYVS